MSNGLPVTSSGAITARPEAVVTSPPARPAVAPIAVVFFQKMPSTRIGKKLAYARPKARATTWATNESFRFRQTGCQPCSEALPGQESTMAPARWAGPGGPVVHSCRYGAVAAVTRWATSGRRTRQP
jgi:hypothetical protein